MSPGRRQKGVVVGVAFGEIRNRKLCKCVGAVNQIVFLLRPAGVVEGEVGEIRRQMADDAVADAATTLVSLVLHVSGTREKNLQTGELLCSKAKFLIQGFEPAWRGRSNAAAPGNDDGHFQIVHQVEQMTAVVE